MSATDTSPSLSTESTPDGPAAAAAKAVELIAQQYRDAIAGLLTIMPLLKYDSRQTRRGCQREVRCGLDRTDDRYGHIRFAGEGAKPVQRV
ncbi:MAG TPA: hypothetical protein VNN25_10025 [Thermoanaerobaculia bacterium]|nr:hypothetical protein [Thermoanaerobaculia bacterium]